MKEDGSNYIHSSISAKYARFLPTRSLHKRRRNSQIHGKFRNFGGNGNKTDMRFMING